MTTWWIWWVQQTRDYGTWFGPQWMTPAHADQWHEQIARGIPYGDVAVLRYRWDGTQWTRDRRDTA